MRLNRREWGTGLCRLLPASLVLIAVGVSLLSLASRTSITRTHSESALFENQLARPKTSTVSSFSQLPLTFEPNLGQADPRVHFTARGSGYGLFLTADEAVLSLAGSKATGSVVRMRLSGANPSPRVEGRELLPGKSNYYVGNDPAKWHVGVPQYSRVSYSQVYPGIDLVYYGHQGQLEYDFEVAPGADPRKVQLSFEGSPRLGLRSGDLVIHTGAGEVRLLAPTVYQPVEGNHRPVNGRFTLLAQNRVGFEIGDYDRSLPLIIDPVLTYSTYLGGTGVEFQPSIAVDAAPNIYLTGATTSPTDFPTSTNPFQATLKGSSNVFITKLDPTGTTLIFSTYFGGTGADTSAGIAADAAGNAYIAGTTTSTDFPNLNGFQTNPVAPGNAHAFVSELSGSGALVYSTYLSGHGTDTVKGMTLDNKGFVYVIGITDSTDFPLAPAAGTFQSTLQGANAFFISKLSPASSGINSLVFSTYFGGGNPTTGTVSGGAIAVDNNSNASNIYFTGGTTYLYTGQNSQTDFPIKNAFQFCLDNPTSTSTTTCSTSATATDAFVAKLNPGTNTGAQLLYCTYLGGSNSDIGQGIGLDASGNAYVTGSTNSNDHPAVSGSITAFQPSIAAVFPATDAFIAKVNNPATGTGSTNVLLTYFSYLGGSTGTTAGNAMAVDNVQGARVVGTTSASNLPVTANAAQGTFGGVQDAFVARLDTTAGGNTSTSQFVTYLGGSDVDTGTGIAIDNDSNTYVTGETKSGNFPSGQSTPFQAGLKGTQDIFAAKLGPSVNFTLGVVPPGSNAVNAGNQISFTYNVQNTGDTTANVLFTDNLSGGSGGAPVTFVSASASGGSCPTTPTDNKVLCNLGTINGGQTSNVTINLVPTGAGTIANSGTVSVGAFSKTTVATPITVNSFKLTALQASNTVVAGNPATYAIQITPQPTYSASISINCSAGLPGGGTTCKPSTTPVTLQNSSPSTVTLVISTIARVTTTASNTRFRNFFVAASLPLAGFAFLGAGVRRRGRRWLGALAFLAIATLILLQPACGGHSSSSTTTGTPAGTYTINVVASSGQFNQTTPITLVVQ